MNKPLQMKIRTINLLVAFIISLFVIFPDVVRQFETGSSDRPMMQEKRRPAPPGFDDRNDESLVQPFNKPEPDFRFSPDKMPTRTPVNRVYKIGFDFSFFFLQAIVLLFFNSWILIGKRKFLSEDKKVLLIIILGDIVICLLFAVIYSFVENSFMRQNFPGPRIFNGMLLFKCFFSGIIASLFGYIIRLIYKQHDMALENERLHSENLQNRFDALTAQINPHFFFNSLNSLASLVREGEYSNSLKYINELSDIFRYVLKSNWKELVSLADEMYFLDAYRYLLEIRYENKLSFDIHVDEPDRHKFRLPVLSLQPVIENVVKHNVISEDDPMIIRISVTPENMLSVSNPVKKKIEAEQGTGIGLDNLDKRYRLLVGKGIDVEMNDELFTVKLPLIH